MIRHCTSLDLETIFEIINDAAQAYKGVIPEDRFHATYMTMNELNNEIASGVVFWGYEDNDGLIGVMGIQDKVEVTLIRHAYVKSNQRNKGVGTKLLTHLINLSEKPFLIGTWESAVWAIHFYLKNGFRLESHNEKERLLRKYWNVPERQIETSVVLSDERWRAHIVNKQ